MNAAIAGSSIAKTLRTFILRVPLDSHSINAIRGSACDSFVAQPASLIDPIIPPLISCYVHRDRFLNSSAILERRRDGHLFHILPV